MRIALYQPDIPQNTGSILRTFACLGIGVDIIEPCGFVWGNKQMKRVSLDYLDKASFVRHSDWSAFQGARKSYRKVLLTTKTNLAFIDFKFEVNDILILGQESAGVPAEVHESVDARITIPLEAGLRSFNQAIAAAIVGGEALRQLNAFPRIHA